MTVIRALAFLLGSLTAVVMVFTPVGWGLAGLAVFLGACFLIVAWTCGAFDRDLYATDIDETHPESLNRRDRNAGIGGTR